MRWGLLLLTLICLGELLGPSLAEAQSLDEPLIESDEGGVRLSWTPAAYSLTTVEVDGEQYSQLQLPGAYLSGEPGQPELPIYSGLIGLPPTGEAQLHIVELEREVIDLPHPPLPSPQPLPATAASLDPQPPVGGSVSYAPNPAIYQANEFFPAEVAELGPVQQLRYQRVARLTINPLRVNPVSRQVEVIRRLRLEITFAEPAAAMVSGLDNSASPFGQALAASLLNPVASQWQSEPRSPAQFQAQSIGALSGEPVIKIIVTQAGFYQLTYNDLASAGAPVNSLDPRTLQLSHGWPRQQVAIIVEGESDGIFHPTDRLLFYAEPEFSRYVNDDIYFLSYGQADGLRMANSTASPDGLPAGTTWRTTVAESNQLYGPNYPARNGDHWYWDRLWRYQSSSGSVSGKTTETYLFELTAPLTTGPAATLMLWLQGYTNPLPDPDHRLAASVNSLPVGETAWNGDQAVEAQFSVPAANLRAGQNQVSLYLPGLNGVLIEETWLDALALTYPTNRGGSNQQIVQGEAGPKSYSLSGWPSGALQLYEISDRLNPRRLTGYRITQNGSTYTLGWGDGAVSPAKYLVVPNNQYKSPAAIQVGPTLTDPPTGADYLIITHPDFAAAIAPLAAHRAAQGLRVVTVNVPQIYDTFGAGRLEPEAIKTFLRHAFANWTPPAPAYVLLVGDGSYDFKNYSGYNPPTFVPPYLAQVDPWWGETAADNQFVTVAGADPLPDMLIGRLAVNSAAQAATVVDKIIRYESAPALGDWNARQLFVADNDEAGVNLYFHADADQGYNQLPLPFIGQRFYYGAGSEPYLYGNVDALRATFLNNFNYGASLVTFHGHSSWLQWAEEGLLRYYPPPYTGPDDLTAMRNQYRLPVVLEMTCFTGSFHRPEVATFDESLLNLAGGGAVAVWGSTGLGVSTGHTALQAGFYRAIYEQGQRSLGAAILSGKMELAGSGAHQELLDTFTLFGDPALRLNFTVVPYSNHIYLPIIQH